MNMVKYFKYKVSKSKEKYVYFILLKLEKKIANKID